jgi:hypothetical protein
VAAIDPGGTAADLSQLPLDYYAPGPEYFYLRDKWGPDATTAMMQMGFPNNKGHQHLDAGSFMMWRSGRWLTRETVTYDDQITAYVDGTQTTGHGTIAHNGLLFDGVGNPEGSQRLAKTIRLESRVDYAFAAVELTPAYTLRDSGRPENANPFAKTAIREFLFLRGLNTLLVFDRVESSSDSLTWSGWPGDKLTAEQVPKTFLLHLEQDAQPTMQDSNHWLSQHGGQVLRVTTLLPAQPTSKVVDERTSASDNVGQYRLQIETKGAAQSYLLHVLQGRDANGKDLAATISDEGDHFRVDLVHPDLGGATIILQKGMTSTGGSVALTRSSCQTQALTQTIQGIEVTDDGVTWGP